MTYMKKFAKIGVSMSRSEFMSNIINCANAQSSFLNSDNAKYSYRKRCIDSYYQLYNNDIQLLLYTFKKFGYEETLCF